MAPAFVQEKDAQFGSPITVQTIAYNSNNAVGDMLFAIASWFAATPGPNPTTTCVVIDSQGNTWLPLPIQFTGSTGGGGNSALQAFYALNCKAGANTVTYTFSDVTANLGIAIGEWSGVNAFNNQATPPNGDIAPASTTPTAYYAGATHNNTELIIGFSSTVTYANWTASTGTLRSTATSVQLGLSDQSAGNGSYAPAFTMSSSASWGAGVAVFYQTDGSQPVQEIDHDDGSSVSRLMDVFSFALPNTAGNLLFTNIVWLSPSDSFPVSIVSVTDTDGNTWLAIGSVLVCTGGSGIGTNGYGQGWYCLNCIGNSVPNTVTVNFTNSGGGGGATYIGRAMAEWSGVNTLGPVAQRVINNAIPSSPNIITTASSSLLVGWGITGCGFVPNTPVSPWNQRATNHRSIALMDQYNQPAGTYSSSLNPNELTSVFGIPTLWGMGIASFFTPLTTYSISGNVGMAGVTINYTGPSSGSVISGAGGAYTILGLLPGTYTITPVFAGFTFSPASAIVVVTAANVAGVNFTPTAVSGEFAQVSIYAAGYQPHTVVCGTMKGPAIHDFSTE